MKMTKKHAGSIQKHHENDQETRRKHSKNIIVEALAAPSPQHEHKTRRKPLKQDETKIKYPPLVR